MVHRMPEIQTQRDGSLCSPILLIAKLTRIELERIRREGTQIEEIFCACFNNSDMEILEFLTRHGDTL